MNFLKLFFSKNEHEISPFLQHKSSIGILMKQVLAETHKQLERGQYPDMHLVGL